MRIAVEAALPEQIADDGEAGRRLRRPDRSEAVIEAASVAVRPSYVYNKPAMEHLANTLRALAALKGRP